MRKIVPCLVLSLAVLVAGVSLAPAAQAQFQYAGDTFVLRTNSEGGQCIVTPLPDGSVDVDCIDGASRAKGNTARGCVFVNGPGQCVTIPLPTHTFATLVLECSNGHKYQLTTGTDGGQCETAFRPDGTPKSASCSDEEGNTASAKCPGGCVRTTGSGSCTVPD